MIYIINEKPYVKVANYYKEVSIDKKGKEFIVKPVGGKETRIENPDYKNVVEMSVTDYYEHKEKKSAGKGTSRNLDMDNLQ